MVDNYVSQSTCHKIYLHIYNCRAVAEDGPQRPIVKKILQKYHEVGKHGRPGNTSEPLEVIIRFSLVHVLDINLSQQVFDFVGWVQLVSKKIWLSCLMRLPLNTRRCCHTSQRYPPQSLVSKL